MWFQRLIATVVIACLALTLATVMISRRSFYHRDALPDVNEEPGWQLQSVRGRICITRIAAVRQWPGAYQLGLEVWDHPLPIVWRSEQPLVDDRLVYSARSMLPKASLSNGFGFARIYDVVAFGTPTRGWTAQGVSIPYWAVLLLFLMPPTLRAGAMLRRCSRARGGLCVRCGYDMRGSPERCPECGTVS